jgi:hypothetical protein
MTGISTPLLERQLLLYFVVAAAVLRPWVIELVRSLPARVSCDRRRDTRNVPTAGIARLPGGHA